MTKCCSQDPRHEDSAFFGADVIKIENRARATRRAASCAPFPAPTALNHDANGNKRSLTLNPRPRRQALNAADEECDCGGRNFGPGAIDRRASRGRRSRREIKPRMIYASVKRLARVRLCGLKGIREVPMAPAARLRHRRIDGFPWDGRPRSAIPEPASNLVGWHLAALDQRRENAAASAWNVRCRTRVESLSVKLSESAAPRDMVRFKEVSAYRTASRGAGAQRGLLGRRSPGGIVKCKGWRSRRVYLCDSPRQRVPRSPRSGPRSLAGGSRIQTHRCAAPQARQGLPRSRKDAHHDQMEVMAGPHQLNVAARPVIS